MQVLKQAALDSCAYYKQIVYSDPLMMAFACFYLTLVLMFIVLRNNPVGTLVLNALGLVAVMNHKRLGAWLQKAEPVFLERKLITVKYFSAGSRFVRFCVILPLFFIILVFQLRMMVVLSKRLLGQKKQEEDELTDAKKKE